MLPNAWPKHPAYNAEALKKTKTVTQVPYLGWDSVRMEDSDLPQRRVKMLAVLAELVERAGSVKLASTHKSLYSRM